ncbi:DUF983 domain-containing protein [Persicitalea jodogahamensis]|uniref:DUF983 domain-containing protein n=1 Tax=Persicitalea jodogahamensis TaxID=402147 RepID=A0A8J3D681_9BACT|nr:DUF983 domain-containing protein [Persicitalea jodogahamensis]GHB80535.1 hypothetical protein GCM10007390_38600 [Persicitalea jodogahamensis]
MNKLYSIFTNTCPKCNVGSFFKTNNPYDLKNFDKLNAHCEYCGESFKREPGFYIGAMYISYALTVAMTVTAFVGFVLIFNFQIEYVLAGLILAILLLLPILFRSARIIWINIFVKYSPEKAEMARQMKSAEKAS